MWEAELTYSSVFDTGKAAIHTLNQHDSPVDE